MDDDRRIDAEWIALNAFRGLTKISTHGDLSRSTYQNSLTLGGEMYPDLLGPDSSLLRKSLETDITKEYRQKAAARSRRDGNDVSPLSLVQEEISEYKDLIAITRSSSGKGEMDRLRARLAKMEIAKKELDIEDHSENQLIFRDAHKVTRHVKALSDGKGCRDFLLQDDQILRLRVLHPEKPEHITGADLIYERHNPNNDEISIVLVQYKIWENKKLYLNDSRMKAQIEKMKKFACQKSICESDKTGSTYRFPCCAAFLRPTDKLQSANQKFISTGEHIPVCQIEKCFTRTSRGAEVLEYENMKDYSLSSDMFEQLFNRGKIGSRFLAFDEIQLAYEKSMVVSEGERVIVYAQDFHDS